MSKRIAILNIVHQQASDAIMTAGARSREWVSNERDFRKLIAEV